MQKTSRNFTELPRISQITNSHCGPAVTQMLLGFLRVRVRQDDVVRAAGSTIKRLNKFGMNLEELAKAVTEIDSNLQFWMKDKATIKDLNELISTYKYPVGVEWQGEFGKYSDDDFGHYSIVSNIDMETKNIYLVDPYKMFAGKDRRFKIDRFEELWWDENEVRNTKTGKMDVIRDNHVIFIITPKNETFPRELKMARG